MELKDRKVLVTGATGFIGSHLVQALLKEGARVRAMGHYRSDPSLQNLAFLTAHEFSRIEFVRGTIEDSGFVRRSVEGCEVVFHLAALIAIPYSYVAPASYVGANISGTLNVLEACRELGVKRMIHTSTSECYGTALYTPIDEKHPLQGQSPYSATKIGADKLAESYHRSFETPVVTVRPFNTYGPRQSGRAVISTIISQLLSGANSLKLGSIHPVRDLTFVSDTVSGFVAAAKAEGVEGQLFNLGVGSGLTIGEIAQKIMRIVGHEVRIEEDKQRVRPEKSEVLKLLSDNSLARKTLGWAPVVSLDEGLEETIAFIRRNQHLYRANEYGV